MKRIRVAVGVVFNAQNKVLVGQRTVKDNYYQKWEFPGGKLETLESAEQALVRELQEELGISVIASRKLIEIEHDYPDRQVQLFVQEVTGFKGTPVGKEGQAIKWVSLQELQTLDFLAGNQPIIECLKSGIATRNL